jgi:hypothetical protein
MRWTVPPPSHRRRPGRPRLPLASIPREWRIGTAFGVPGRPVTSPVIAAPLFRVPGCVPRDPGRAPNPASAIQKLAPGLVPLVGGGRPPSRAARHPPIRPGEARVQTGRGRTGTASARGHDDPPIRNGGSGNGIKFSGTGIERGQRIIRCRQPGPRRGCAGRDGTAGAPKPNPPCPRPGTSRLPGALAPRLRETAIRRTETRVRWRESIVRRPKTKVWARWRSGRESRAERPLIPPSACPPLTERRAAASPPASRVLPLTQTGRRGWLR